MPSLSSSPAAAAASSSCSSSSSSSSSSLYGEGSENKEGSKQADGGTKTRRGTRLFKFISEALVGGEEGRSGSVGDVQRKTERAQKREQGNIDSDTKGTDRRIEEDENVGEGEKRMCEKKREEEERDWKKTQNVDRVGSVLEFSGEQLATVEEGPMKKAVEREEWGDIRRNRGNEEYCHSPADMADPSVTSPSDTPPRGNYDEYFF